MNSMSMRSFWVWWLIWPAVDCLAAGTHRHAVTVVYQFVAESFGMLLRAF